MSRSRNSDEKAVEDNLNIQSNGEKTIKIPMLQQMPIITVNAIKHMPVENIAKSKIKPSNESRFPRIFRRLLVCCIALKAQTNECSKNKVANSDNH